MGTEVTLLRKGDSSPFIIGLKDYFEGGTESVIVMDYAEGKDLFSTLSGSSFILTEAKVRVIMGQVLEAVDYLHRLRVVHLDIKPNNILFESPNIDSLKIRLIDFGLARELGGMDKVKCNMVGTLEFMAPEVMKCTFASTASDMWSVGVLFYMLISGGLSPFWGGNDYGTQRKVVRADYNFDCPEFKLVSESAKNLIRRLLLLTHSKRLTAKGALSHPWLKPDTKTYELSKVTRLETTMMRRYLARRRWRMLKILKRAVKPLDKTVPVELACGVFPVDNILFYQVKKNKLRKCFRKKSITKKGVSQST